MSGKTLILLSAALATGALNVGSASAAKVVDVQDGALLVRGTWANFGYSFSSPVPIRVEALGLLDVGANGLAEPHEVGLWDNTGALVAQAVVNTNTPSSPAAMANTAWKFESITPLDLPAGTYKVGAFYRTTGDAFVGSLNGTFATYSIDPALTYGAPFITPGGTESFSEPTAAVSANLTPGFFGPNVQLTVLPEPALLGALPAAVAMMRRRRAV